MFRFNQNDSKTVELQMSATIKNKAECQQLYGTNSILSLFAPSLKSPLGYNSSKIWISHCFFQLKWLFIESMKVVTLPLLKNYFVEFNIVTFLLSTTFCEVDNLCPRFESFGDISMKIMREFFLEIFFHKKFQIITTIWILTHYQCD